MPYGEALRIQTDQAQRLLQGDDNQQTLYTVEHPPTITIGRNGSPSNIVAEEMTLEAEGVDVYEVDRGGDVTFHGPGQLVVYPVLHLGGWHNDVGRYVRMLEEVVIQAIAEVGLEGVRDEAYPGVWVNQKKICAVGCRVKRRRDGEFVTYHGIALNVHTPLRFFDFIIPCGIQDRGVTSLTEELGSAPAEQTLTEWEHRMMKHFSNVFDLAFHTVQLGEFGGTAR